LLGSELVGSYRDHLQELITPTPCWFKHAAFWSEIRANSRMDLTWEHVEWTEHKGNLSLNSEVRPHQANASSAQLHSHCDHSTSQHLRTTCCVTSQQPAVLKGNSLHMHTASSCSVSSEEGRQTAVSSPHLIRVLSSRMTEKERGDKEAPVRVENIFCFLLPYICHSWFTSGKVFDTYFKTVSLPKNRC